MSGLTVIEGGKQSDTEVELLGVQQEMIDTINYVDEYSWNKGLLGGLDWGMELFNEAFDGLQPGLMMIGGQPNIGKSALCMNLAWTISRANTEVIEGTRPHKAYVLYFSLDDNATELLPRFVAIDQRIPINVIKAPMKYQEDITMMTRRAKGLNNLRKAAENFKIIDSTKGNSIEFIEAEIKRHIFELATLDDSYKVVAIIDNFHDIAVEGGNFRGDNNVKYDFIAGELSRICTQLDIPMICTAEFRKLNGNRRPVVDDLRETVKIAYEAKAIMLCYNEVGLRGEAASIGWNRPDSEFKQPIMEVKIGKNKYSSFKNRIFFEFMPEMSYLKEVPSEGAKRYSQMIIG